MGFFDVFKGLAAPVVDYFKTRAELKSKERMHKMELDDALHARKVELISKGLTADMNWEMEFAKQAESSWKDEATLIVVSIPLILCFIPGMDGYVLKGFEVLDKTPDYFKLLVLTIYFATYGIRYWRRTQSDT